MKCFIETRDGLKLTDHVIERILTDLKYQHYSRYGIKSDKETGKIGPTRKTYVLEDMYEDLSYILHELTLK